MVGGNGNLKGGLLDASVEALVRPLARLEATYRAFDAAQRELEGSIGVPICVSGCAKCCEVTTVMVWDIEARFMVSWLLGQGTTALERVLSLCDGWLLDRDRRLPTYGLQGSLTQEQCDSLRPEVDALLLTMPCPLLTQEKTCLLHGARPLTCRAYGVSHLPAYWCPRPLSRYETQDTRAHIGDHTPVGRKLHRMVNMVLTSNGGGGVRFLPMALYALLRPEKLNAYVADNRIASAKLVALQSNTAILFQSQLDEVWRQASVAGAPETTSGGQNVGA